MAGNKGGGVAAARTNKQKYGVDFYARIGAIGGANSRGGGFTKETAAIWGKLGGSLSTRGQKLSEAERKQRRDKFQKQYEKTLQRLQNVHAAAMQGREQS